MHTLSSPLHGGHIQHGACVGAVGEVMEGCAAPSAIRHLGGGNGQARWSTSLHWGSRRSSERCRGGEWAEVRRRRWFVAVVVVGASECRHGNQREEASNGQASGRAPMWGWCGARRAEL